MFLPTKIDLDINNPGSVRQFMSMSDFNRLNYLVKFTQGSAIGVRETLNKARALRELLQYAEVLIGSLEGVLVGEEPKRIFDESEDLRVEPVVIDWYRVIGDDVVAKLGVSSDGYWLYDPKGPQGIKIIGTISGKGINID